MLLAVCVGFSAALISFSAPLLLIPAIALIGALSFIWGTGYAVVSLFFACIGILGTNISDPIGIIFFFIPFVAASAVLIGGFRRRLPYRYIALLLAFFALVSLYGQISVPALMQGEPAYSALIASLKEWEIIAAGSGLDVSGFSDTLSLVPTVFYGYMILISEFIGFIIVVLGRYFCTLGKVKPRPMAKFADWELPSNLRIGIPVLAVGCIIAFIAHFKAADVLLFAVLSFILPPLTVQGLSSVMFMLIRSKGGKRPSGFSIALLIILLLFSPLIFSIFGLIELYARSRSRFRRYDKKIREAYKNAEITGSNTVTVDFEDGQGPRVIAVRKKHDDAYYDDDLKLDDDEQQTKKDAAGETDGTEDPAKNENKAAGEADGNVSGSNAAGTADPENTFGITNAEDTFSAGNADNTGNPENPANAVNSANYEDSANSENPANYEDSVNTENSANTENNENSVNTENKENKENKADTNDTGN